MNRQIRHCALIFLVLLVPLFAQTYYGSLLLSKQSMIDNFNYTEVTGNLIVQGSGITNVQGLSELTTVGGDLIILSAHNLSTLEGLSQVSTVGGALLILSNSALTSLDGFSGIEHVSKYFIIQNNPNLTQLFSRSSLTTIGGYFKIYYNNNLNSLGDLSLLSSVGGTVFLMENPSLSSTFGLSGLQTVGGLTIQINASLENVDGFSSLTTIDGSLSIEENPKLTNLDGLAQLTTVTVDIFIAQNSSLTNLDGLSNVESVSCGLTVMENPVLTRFCGLYTMLDQNPNLEVYIGSNAYNPTVQEILDDGLCSKGGIKGMVWFDSDQNGLQEEGETGLWGVTIKLYDQDGNLVNKAETMPSGFYYLKNVDPGEYTLKVDLATLPSDYVLTGGTHPARVEWSDHDELNTVSFGFYGSEPSMSLPLAADPAKGDNELILVSGSPTKMGKQDCSWENAVDGDMEGWDGTTLARNENDPSEPPWAIFQFNSGGIFQFNIIAFQTDNGTDDDGMAFDYQTRRFEVLVSTDGLESDDFISLGTISRRFDGTKTEYHKLDEMVSARYIKIRLLSPQMPGGWRQLVEFRPTTWAKGGAVPAAAHEQIAEVPIESALSVFPNPFNPSTTIDYAVENDREIRVLVYDLRGREVARLAEGFHPAGAYQVTWHAGDMPSGLYFVRLISGGEQRTRRITLVK